MGVQISTTDLFDLFKFMEEANLPIEKVIDFVKREAKKVAARNGEDFTLEIDYEKNLSEMIADGKYSYFEDEVAEQNSLLPIGLYGCIIKLEAKLFHFDFPISSEEAILEMEKNAYRPATLAELLSFGKEHRDAWPEKTSVISLGSFWFNDLMEKRNACIDFEHDQIILDADTDYNGCEWDQKCRFLAIKVAS